MRKLLFKAPAGNDQRLVRQSDVLAQECNISYRHITSKENKDRRGEPVLVCMVDSDGYWYVVSNDPEFAGIEEAAANLKKWEKAPAME